MYPRTGGRSIKVEPRNFGSYTIGLSCEGTKLDLIFGSAQGSGFDVYDAIDSYVGVGFEVDAGRDRFLVVIWSRSQTLGQIQEVDPP